MRYLLSGIIAALFMAPAAPANATGIFVRDFQRFESDPQYDAFVHGYMEGLVEGTLVGNLAEAKARSSNAVKSICIDPSSRYGADDALRDVRGYLAAHPETPGNWTVGTVLAITMAKQYPCK
jgi:hypothetical protein